MESKYYDVKEMLPPIMKRVRVFWEKEVNGGHGNWYEGHRVSETHFKILSTNEYLVKIDLSDTKTLGVGITHWADMESDNLPNLCRRIDCCMEKLIWKDGETPEDIRQKMLNLVGKNVVAKKGASKTGYFTIFSVGEIYESVIVGIGGGFIKFLEGDNKYTASDGSYNFRGSSEHPIWAFIVVYGIKDKNGCTMTRPFQFNITRKTKDYFEDLKKCSFVYYNNHPFLFYESEKTN